MTVATLDDLHAMVGRSLGESAWHVIDQEKIDDFARVTLDEQWIHVDPDRASVGPFGTTIAHGYLVLSLCARFLEECLDVQGASVSINYGTNRVRFPSPVPVGTRVRGAVELVSLDDVAAGVQAVLRVTVIAENATKPACVADLVIRYQR